MELTQEEIRKRLAYVLHLGLVEARNLALAEGHLQIADLADALEVLPRLMENCKEDDLEMVRLVLREYQAKYHAAYDLPARFERAVPGDY
jgi:hypothetical protein